MTDQSREPAEFVTEGPDEVCNLIVVTERGVGTLSALYREMNEKGFLYTTLSAEHLLGAFPGAAIVGDGIDTLVLDEPGELLFHPHLRDAAEQLATTRTAAGQSYPRLKRVVLVYLETREHPSQSHLVKTDGVIPTAVLTRHRTNPGSHDGHVTVRRTAR